MNDVSNEATTMGRGLCILVNANAKRGGRRIAVQIARADLSAICRAVGVLAPKDSVDLHNLPLVIHVRCKKRTDTGEIVNEVKGYAKKEAPLTVTTAAPSASPPWKRS